MNLNWISLRNFRSYRNVAVYLNPKFNLLIGENGTGKTNMLESIFFLGRKRSFRTFDYHNLIRRGSNSSNVESIGTSEGVKDRFGFQLGDDGKIFSKNEKKIKGMLFNVVLFAPEETLLLKGIPEKRRTWIDDILFGIIETHYDVIKRYERVLRQRNHLLKKQDEMGISMVADVMEGFDYQLAAFGAEVVVNRRYGAVIINETLPSIYSKIAGREVDIRLKYEPHSYDDWKGEGDKEEITRYFMEALRKKREDELARKITLIGPQRDELTINLGFANAKNFASQGEHRSIVLALKMTEVELLRKTNGAPPIVLLDDVASELDDERIRRFFSFLVEVEGQVFVTATSPDILKYKDFEESEFFDVSKGLILKRKKEIKAVHAT